MGDGACSIFEIPECLDRGGSRKASMPGVPVRSQTVVDIRRRWGFDRLHVYTAPLPLHPEAVVLPVVVLRVVMQNEPVDVEGEEVFLHLLYVPFFGMRYMWSPRHEVSQATSVGCTTSMTPVFSFRIADLLDEWLERRKTKTIEDPAEFAEGITSACRMQEHYATHFELVRKQLLAFYEAENEKRRKTNATALTAVATGSAMLLCTVQ